jgi:outer membrane protein OmpA-like peptidoglycan-associated protein
MTEGDTDYLVVVLIADRNDLYSVDVVTSAAMEQNTVALNLEALRSEMESKGRVAIYGILFDTGSAAMRAESEDALQVITQYLKENPKRSFYVVGHTDDQGSLSTNIQLSQARAESTVKAIADKLPGSKSRLTAHGVGPLSPISTNTREDGRQLNRRVEFVSSLD